MIEDLLKDLNLLDEHPTLEAKACSSGQLGNSFFETVCAFANEPGQGGGRILLGVGTAEGDWFGGYEVVGVADPDKLQSDIATGCGSIFNVPIRPRIVPEVYREKVVLIVEIEERAPSEKPVYFRKQHLPLGAWRRIGSSDQRCTEDDMVVFFGSRQEESPDLMVLRHSTAGDFDPDAIEHYRELRRRANPQAEELSFNDHDLLASLNAIREQSGEWHPTLTGLLIFGSRLALRRELPVVRVDYIRVAGKEWVEDPDRRFVTTVDMRGPLLQLVDRISAAVMDDLPKGFDLKEGRNQADTPTLPARVIREAIVNALMHRSYREHQPTQVIRYSNRIEIKNAGFSIKNEDALGQTGSEPRNPNLAAIFHETNTAETKGSGIRTMRRLMQENGFSLPTFESSRSDNHFITRLLLHHFLSEADIEWLGQIDAALSDSQRVALIFLREQGAIDNPTLRQLTDCDVLTASNDLRKLRDLKLLTQKGKGTATYYVAGADFPEDVGGRGGSEHATLGEKHDTLATGHDTSARGHDTLATTLPAAIQRRIDRLGGRPGHRIRSVILELCAWRELSANQLARLLNDRNVVSLKREHLSPMVRAKELEYTHRDMEKHPDQAYRTPRGNSGA